MNFKVCGLDTIDQVLRDSQPTHVLSVIEKSATPDLTQAWSVQDHKVVNFHDIITPLHPGAPTIDDCREILRWGKTLPEDAKVLVHCMVGISRSTCSALALMYLEALNNPDEWAAPEYGPLAIDSLGDILVENRPIAYPNLLMAEYFDELFQLRGAFINKVKKIRAASPFLKILEQEQNQ